MRLTNEEWSRHAEIAAAHKFGEEHAGWYQFRRYAAGPVGILVLAAVAGGGAYWLWRHVRPAVSGPTGLPVAFWVLLAMLVLGTAIAFRPRQAYVRPAATMVRAVIFSLLWLGFVAYGLTVML